MPDSGNSYGLTGNSAYQKSLDQMGSFNTFSLGSGSRHYGQGGNAQSGMPDITPRYAYDDQDGTYQLNIDAATDAADTLKEYGDKLFDVFDNYQTNFQYLGDNATVSNAQLQSRLGEASSDYQANADLQQAEYERDMRRMGVNPNSARFAGFGTSNALHKAAGLSAIQNQVRDTVREESWNRNLGVAELGLDTARTATDGVSSAANVYKLAADMYTDNKRLGELARRQQEYNGQEQQQALTQQSIDKNNSDLFYDRQRQHDELINRQYGIGQTGRQSPAPPAPQGSQTGYGMPMERKETVVSPLTQDAGKLNRMLQKYHQGRDQRDAEDAINFINQHPGIKADKVSSIQMNHSDRNEDPLVSLLGDDGNPVKQFYLSSLSNLNNFAGQRQQTYDPGSKGVSDVGKLMEQLMPMAEAMATQSLVGQNLKPDELSM